MNRTSCIPKVFLALVLITTSLAYAQAETKTGEVHMPLINLTAITGSGAPDPANTPLCQKNYGGFLGKEVSANYTIIPEKGFVSAQLAYLGTDAHASTLGASAVYGFVTSFNATPNQPVDYVLFVVSHDFKTTFSSAGLIIPKSNVRCLFTSANYAVKWL